MLHEVEVPLTRSEPVRQVHDFKSGNEAAALAARDIGFHVMGYFPITPSTEVAENLSQMQADGDLEEAERLMLRAITLQPMNARFRRAMAEILRGQGREDEARAQLEKAAAFSPADEAGVRR